jgi:hypothetical protein
MITSVLAKSSGFYSQLFFLLEHYLFSINNKCNFIISSSEWLFKYQLGWEDYFVNVDITNGNNNVNMSVTHYKVIGNCPVSLYKSAIKNVYVYNNLVKEKIELTKNKLSLQENYDAIFIRRGDKLISESDFISTEKYIEILLNKNPNCHSIFLQTDDYNCVLDMKKYISEKKLNINLITLCNENNKGGMIIFNAHKNNLKGAMIGNKNNANKHYISSVIDNLHSATPIDTLNNEEVYQHTLDMLIGIQIVLEANIVVCEYSSNVSRFIKIAHKNSNNVFDVNKPDKDIDWNKTICPAFDFYY